MERLRHITVLFSNGDELNEAWWKAHIAGVMVHQLRLRLDQVLRAEATVGVGNDNPEYIKHMLQNADEVFRLKMKDFRAIEGWQRFALVKAACMMPTSAETWDAALNGSDPLVRDVMFNAQLETLRICDTMRLAQASGQV